MFLVAQMLFEEHFVQGNIHVDRFQDIMQNAGQKDLYRVWKN